MYIPAGWDAACFRSFYTFDKHSTSECDVTQLWRIYASPWQCYRQAFISSK